MYTQFLHFFLHFLNSQCWSPHLMFGGENLYHQKQAREGPVHSQAHVHQINQYINLLNLVILVSHACEQTGLRVYLAPAIQTPHHIITSNIQNVIPPWQPDSATSTIMSHIGHDARLPCACFLHSEHEVAKHRDQHVTWLLMLPNLVVMVGSHSGCCRRWCDVVSVLLVQGSNCGARSWCLWYWVSSNHGAFAGPWL